MEKGYGVVKKLVYICNVCGTETEYPEGMKGFTLLASAGLVSIKRVQDSDIHICFPCIESVGKWDKLLEVSAP